ncbi:MAG: GNAT family protein [Polyangiales bacterium]
MTERELPFRFLPGGATGRDRVHAFVRDDNARSSRLLERCGFTREGRLRRYRVCRGEARDFDVYALLRDEWERR